MDEEGVAAIARTTRRAATKGPTPSALMASPFAHFVVSRILQLRQEGFGLSLNQIRFLL